MTCPSPPTCPLPICARSLLEVVVFLLTTLDFAVHPPPDIEGSTQLSVAGRDVYDQLLAIHDQLMREGIAKFNG